MFSIDASHFYAGGVYDDVGICYRAAPIIKYMIGWTEERVAKYCRQKGWQYEYWDA